MTAEPTPVELARQFLDACADIENALKKRLGLEATTLGAVVRAAEARDGVVRRNRVALEAFVELRNVLSHRRYEGGAPIATPLASTVRAVQRLRDEILRPRPALALAARDVLVAQHDDPLQGVLRAMLAANISQVPVRLADGRVAILTTNAIARLVAAHLEPDGSVLIEASTTSDALAFAEAHETVKLVPRSMSAAAALDVLMRPSPPSAVLITEHGSAPEAPLGILSAADIVSLVDAVTVQAF